VFFFSGTRQRASLPSAKEKTLGKKCQKTLFAECFFTLGKDPLYRVQKKKTLDKENFKSKFKALNKFKSKSFELQDIGHFFHLAK